jgi:hypothetical protein
VRLSNVECGHCLDGWPNNKNASSCFFYGEKYENMLIVETDAKSKFIGGATGKKLQIER